MDNRDGDYECSKEKRKRIKKVKVIECGCGKRCKMKSTFETHVRQSHNGIVPESIKQLQKATRRKSKLNELKQIQKYENSMTNPLTVFDRLVLQFVQSELNIRSIYERQPAYELIMRYNEQRGSQEIKFVQEDKIYEVSMGRGINILFQDLRKVISHQPFLDQIVLLITIYASYVIEETEDQNVLNNGNIGIIAELINYFIIFELSRHCERLKLHKLWISKPNNALAVFDLIFKWLNYKKFSHTTVNINSKYTIAVDDQLQKDQGQ